MSATSIVLFFAASIGVDVGWQPLDQGGLEYIIQIDPETIDLLREGKEIVSEVPPAIGPVRTYRVRIGEGRLPRTALTSHAADSFSEAASARSADGSSQRGENAAAGQSATPPRQSGPPRSDPFAIADESHAGSSSTGESSSTAADATSSAAPTPGAPPSSLLGPRYADSDVGQRSSTTPAPRSGEGPRLGHPGQPVVQQAPHDASHIGAQAPSAPVPDTTAGVPAAGVEPHLLPDEPQARPVEQAASYQHAVAASGGADADSGAAKGSEAATSENARIASQAYPPAAWIALAIALAVSLGGNAYLLLVALSQRRSYRRLASRVAANTG